VRPALFRSYEGQIKMFLVLLVLFLAVAIYFNVHLLLIARNTIQDEAEERLALEADVVRAELERDQMIRGVSPAAPAQPYIPPTYLDRIARLRGLASIEILGLDGRVLSSSVPARVGRRDATLGGADEGPRRRLLSGGSVVRAAEGGGARGLTLAAYRPIQDRSRTVVSAIRIEAEAPALASVDFNLRTIAALQAGGLVFVLVLVTLFARWLLQPYRRLAHAVAGAPGGGSGLQAGPSPGEPDFLVEAFQGVLDRLREQEGELHRLKQGGGDRPGSAALPGESLVRGMASAVLVFDREGRLAVLNPAAEALLGADRAHAVGLWYDQLFTGHPRLTELLEGCLRRGESHSREVITLPGADGRTLHLGAMISPVLPAAHATPGGPADGALCLLADLTEIKALRERVGLKENLAALGEMSAGIAHEFRNSLATIQGYARLIGREGGGGGSAGEDAEAILREIAGMRKIVDDFLRFARPAALDLGEVDLRSLVQELVGDLRSDPAGTAAEVTVEGGFPRIVADETLLRQALQNLLRNAAEAVAPESGGPPGTAHRIVVRGAVAPDGGVRIEVEDDGPGIPDDVLPRLFAPFFTTKEKGTGLGLALVQKAAVVHDGRVEVRRGARGGACFALILPARPGVALPVGPLA
jgi:signal transduction histidine kinase